MTAYFIITQEEVLIEEPVDDVGVYAYYDRISDIVEAPTRGKARAMFCAEHGLDFTTPLYIRKLSKPATAYEVDGVGDEVGETPLKGGHKLTYWEQYAIAQYDEAERAAAE